MKPSEKRPNGKLPESCRKCIYDGTCGFLAATYVYLNKPPPKEGWVMGLSKVAEQMKTYEQARELLEATAKCMLAILEVEKVPA